MLKKAGLVAAATVGLSLVIAPAMASAAPMPSSTNATVQAKDVAAWPSFGDAFNTFIAGGGAAGAGAAALVAGAYTGVATTPGLILHSVTG